MPTASSPSNVDRMPVINTAAREPVDWRSTNADLNPASPLTFVVEKVNRTQNNTTHTLAFPLAFPIETTVDGISVVENPPGLSNEQEAGIIIGSLLLLIIIGILVYCWMRYRKRSENILLLDPSSPTMPPYNTPDGGQGAPPSILHPSAGESGFGEHVVAGHGVGPATPELAGEIPHTEVPGVAAPGEQDADAQTSRGAHVPAAPDSNVVAPQGASEEPASGQEGLHQDPNTQHPVIEETETQGAQPQIAHQTAEQNTPAQAPAQHNDHRQAAGNSGAAEYRGPDNKKYSERPLRGILSRRHRWSRKRHDQPPAASTSRASVSDGRTAGGGMQSQAPQQHFAPATQHYVPPSAPEPPPPPQRPPSSHAMPRRHVTFQDDGDTRWETGEEGAPNQEEPPFFFRPRPDVDGVSEFHRRGDEQAARVFNASRSREGRFAKYRPATYPPADARSASAHSYQPATPVHRPPSTPSTGRHQSRRMPTAQYHAGETPQMREAAETQGIEQAWQHVMDEQAEADDFYDWYEGVAFYTTHMGWRATYIEDMREHRAQQRARSLREAKHLTPIQPCSTKSELLFEKGLRVDRQRKVRAELDAGSSVKGWQIFEAPKR